MTPSESEKGTQGTKKPASVRQFLRERTAQAAKKREEKQADRTVPKAQPGKQQKTVYHKQPQRAARKKSKAKERG